MRRCHWRRARQCKSSRQHAPTATRPRPPRRPSQHRSLRLRLPPRRHRRTRPRSSRRSPHFLPVRRPARPAMAIVPTLEQHRNTGVRYPTRGVPRPNATANRAPSARCSPGRLSLSAKPQQHRRQNSRIRKTRDIGVPAYRRDACEPLRRRLSSARFNFSVML